jgi:hypothetical protein
MGKDAIKSITSLFIKLDQPSHNVIFKLFLERVESYFLEHIKHLDKARIPHSDCLHFVSTETFADSPHVIHSSSFAFTESRKKISLNSLALALIEPEQSFGFIPPTII